MLITKRDGTLQELDISKIQKQTVDATANLQGTSQSDLELDAKINFVDRMSSEDIQNTLIHTAVNKIDIDAPNWTFVAARLFLFDLYHRVGREVGGTKGSPYGYFAKYIEHGQSAGKIIPNLQDGYDLEDLEKYIEPERDYLFNYLGIKTLNDRYLIKDNEGKPIELPQQMFMAIAMFLAQDEENKQQRAKEFYDVVSKFEVMLATPTLSNARTNRHQLSSCYIGSTPDNIEGIMDTYYEQALLSKFGGGIGWDWNQVRAQASVIDGNKGASGGTVPFLKIENDVALAVDQLGTRKGAIAVYIEPWHADIIDFIDLKKNSGEERRRAHDLFPSLWITDLFMERIEADAEWTLFDPYQAPSLSELHGDEFKDEYIKLENDPNINKTVMKAKDLWKKILTSYFESGSPFLCFKDTANRANPNKHTGKIRSSNLCTEIFQNTKADEYLVKIWYADGANYFTAKETDDIQLANGTTKKANKVTSLDTILFKKSEDLGPDITSKVYNVEKHQVNGDTAVCNLASVNLSRINTKEDIERVVPIVVRMLDNVIDLNFYPLKKVKDTNLKTRAIGLGQMGEAQMLAEKQIMFGSDQHLELIDNIGELISFNAIKASSNLAIEKGAYPQFKGSHWEEGVFPHTLAPIATYGLTSCAEIDCDWDKLREQIKINGMRNGYLMAIAPTSSISILVGTTQAIEPVYKRKWFEENLSGLIPVVVPKLSPETFQYYKPAFEVDQLDIIKAAAVRQKWIDQGQSLNIFMQSDKASGKYLNDIYMSAWKFGLKSTYYLRSESPDAAKAEMQVEDRSLECSGCQ